MICKSREVCFCLFGAVRLRSGQALKSCPVTKRFMKQARAIPGATSLRAGHGAKVLAGVHFLFAKLWLGSAR